MLELTDLTKRYADFAFGPVDLTVGQEVLAVLGPSGSGKTTLLSLVAGILDPDGGSISLDGRPLDGRSVEERRTGLVCVDIDGDAVGGALVQPVGDRLAIVRDGGLEQVGAPQSVLERPANRFVARFTGTENIYDGTVTADGVRVGDTEILTDTGGPVGAAATLCLHPARIELVGPTADGPGVLPGTVTHWLNEGTAYRVAVDIDAAIDPLTVSIAPATFDALGADSGESVGVRIPPAAPHLLR